MKFYAIEKKRNPQCLQCGANVRRVNIKISRNIPCIEIINSLKRVGYEPDPDMDQILTIMDFNNIKEIDLNLIPDQNKLRYLELITAVGFKGGEIFINLIII